MRESNHRDSFDTHLIVSPKASIDENYEPNLGLTFNQYDATEKKSTVIKKIEKQSSKKNDQDKQESAKFMFDLKDKLSPFFFKGSEKDDQMTANLN